MDNSLIIKRRLITLSVAIILLIIPWSLIRLYVLDGKLIVLSDPKAKITLITPNSKKGKQIGVGKANIRLPEGEYIVEAAEASKVTRTDANIISHRTTSMKLDLIDSKTPTVALSNKVADSIHIGSDGAITFLNAPFHVLYKSSGGSYPEPYLPQLYPISRVDWLSQDDALANLGPELVSIDASGNARGTGLSLAGQASSYTVAQSGAIAYISNKNLVFKKSFAASDISDLIRLSTVNYLLSISPDGRYISAFLDIQGVDSSKTEESKTSSYILDSTSHRIPTTLSTSEVINGSVWSPNNLLAYAVGSKINFYKPDTKTKSEFMPSNSPNPVWLLGFTSNDELFYAQGSSIWKLDSKTKIAYKITQYEGSINQNSFALTHDNKAYFSTTPDTQGNGGNIYKVQL